jgi:hypothetical protein
MFQSFTNENYNKLHVLWNPQKISNVHSMIQVIRVLVVPNSSTQVFYSIIYFKKIFNQFLIIVLFLQSVTDCQKIMRNCNLLQALCDILIIPGVPTDILTEAICAVAEVIRGNTCNQEFLADVMAPSTPPRL